MKNKTRRGNLSGLCPRRETGLSNLPLRLHFPQQTTTEIPRWVESCFW